MTESQKWPADTRPLSTSPDATDADAARLLSLKDYWSANGPHKIVNGILSNPRPLLRMESAGLGKWFDDVLGGGIAIGEVLALGAAGAGVGKTALVHQMADGWAEASGFAWKAAEGSGERPTVTPVIYVTEMSVRALTIRTLARRAGVPGKVLRAPAAFGQELAHQVISQAAKAAQMFESATPFLYPVDRTTRIGGGEQAVRTLGNYAEKVRDDWSKRGDVSTVILVIDPLHRLLEAGADETGALGDVLGTLLAETQQRGLVSIFTSDTTKSAAAARSGQRPGDETPDNDAEALAEQAFRGSYQLMHIPDHVMVVRTFDSEKTEQAEKFKQMREAYDRRPNGPPIDAATVYADLSTPKLRWGKVGDRPAFWFDRAFFRFEPMVRPVVAPSGRPADDLSNIIGGFQGR